MPARATLLKILVASGFVLHLLLTPRLWWSTRTFPLAPVWDALPPIPFPWDYAWYAVLLGLLIASIGVRRPRPFILVFVALQSVYTLWDQARWTPIVYQYTFLLLALGFYPWEEPSEARAGAVLNTCRVVCASTYVWAGLQKVNVTFFWHGFPLIVKPLVGTLPDTLRGWPLPLGLIAAAVEAGIGVALLTHRWRQMAVVAAVAMHGFILLAIGPVGHRWDTEVWPWNVVMAMSIGVLFWRTPKVGPRDILRVRRFMLHPVVCALFGLMPVLSFVDLWDSHLSAGLYSDNTRLATVYLTDEAKRQLPAEIQRHVRSDAEGRYVLDLFRWSFADLNLEPYPEPRVYKAIARRLCRQTADGTGITLVIYDKPGWRTGRRTTRDFTCADVAAK